MLEYSVEIPLTNLPQHLLKNEYKYVDTCPSLDCNSNRDQSGLFLNYIPLLPQYFLSTTIMVSFKSLILVIMAAGSTLAMPKPTEPLAMDIPAPKVETIQARANHYMDIVGEWRQRIGRTQLLYHAPLEANALNAVREANGQIRYKLNPGSFAQVMGPGACDLNGFYRLFVGGWLCGRPNLPGLNGICANFPEYVSQTPAHADILTTAAYSRIGCGCAANIWACDLA